MVLTHSPPPSSFSGASYTFSLLTHVAAGTNNLPQRRRRRNRLSIHRSAAPLPRSRRAREAHIPIHQYPRRQRDGRPRHLRHHDLHLFTRDDDVRGASGVDGLVAAVRRRAQEALLPAAQQHHGASAERRVFWAGE